MADPAIDFWADLDTTFKYSPSQEVQTLYLVLFSQPGSPFDFSRVLKLWNHHRAAGTYPAGFVTDLLPLTASFARLAELQLQVLDNHFSENVPLEQSAFELFGQGVLYDDTRPVGDKVHLMDTGGLSNPPIGYHRWHVFARTLMLFGSDVLRWLQIDREIGLAWAIQSELKPIPDSRVNPPMAPSRLVSLRGIWLSMSADNLDIAFDSFPYPSTGFALSEIERIKAILESLVGGQQIAAHGNYWRNFSTGDDFVQFHVFGDPQLPLLVKGDANSSNLVKALEGTAPFDGALFPRMPVPGIARRYATTAEIKIIRDWIDAGCH